MQYKGYIYIISKMWSSRICQICIPARFQFFMYLKKEDKVVGKNTVTFIHDIGYMLNSFVFIIYDKYD